jgi:RNA polymerase sigma factor (sigma-70 family)
MIDAQRVKAAAEQLVIEATHGKMEWERAWEIRKLVNEQIADDRSTIGHASGGTTGTFRIGSTWVNSLPGGDTTMDAHSPWQDREEVQEDLAHALDRVLAVLTDDEKQLMHLRYDHLTPLREIGSIVGVSKDTVTRMLETLRSRVHASLVMLLGVAADDYYDVRAALVETARTIGEDR